MKVKELYDHVAQLGFEETIEYTRGFLNAANRSVLQAASVRPAIRRCVLNHNPLHNEAGSSYKSELADGAVFEAETAKAYYFEANGAFSASIQGYNGNEWTAIGTITSESNAERNRYTAYRGFIRDNGEFTDEKIRIKFESPYICYVRKMAMYKNIYSDRAEDIPAYDPYVRYDISRMVDDFMGLSSPPFDEETRNALFENYDIEDNRVILLSRELSGEYGVLYKHKPNVITSDDPSTDDTDIDLDEDLCNALPLLVASYVWADDEPEKAMYYMTLYRERTAEIYSATKDSQKPVKMISANGW